MAREQQPWLDVPYAEKDAAKAAGARWDPTARRWFAPRPGVPELARWTPRPRADGEPVPGPAVPAAQRPPPPKAASTAPVGPAGPVRPWWAFAADRWDDLAGNVPGQGITREASRRRDAGDDDRSWRVGADGEAMLAEALANLTHPRGLARWSTRAARGGRWRVLHSVPVGVGHTDIDHVLIGPPGVVTINTKHIGARRRVDVEPDEVHVGGRRTSWAAAARHEATRAARLLATAAAAHLALDDHLGRHSTALNATPAGTGTVVDEVLAMATITTALGPADPVLAAPGVLEDLAAHAATPPTTGHSPNAPTATTAATGHRPATGPATGHGADDRWPQASGAPWPPSAGWPPMMAVLAVIGAPLHGRRTHAGGVMVATPATLARTLSVLPAVLDEPTAAAVDALARRSTTWTHHP